MTRTSLRLDHEPIPSTARRDGQAVESEADGSVQQQRAAPCLPDRRLKARLEKSTCIRYSGSTATEPIPSSQVSQMVSRSPASTPFRALLPHWKVLAHLGLTSGRLHSFLRRYRSSTRVRVSHLRLPLRITLPMTLLGVAN